MQRAFQQGADYDLESWAERRSFYEPELEHVDNPASSTRQGHLDRNIELGRGGNAGSIVKRQHLWTIKHSFFALMGGFAIDVSDLPPH